MPSADASDTTTCISAADHGACGTGRALEKGAGEITSSPDKTHLFLPPALTAETRKHHFPPFEAQQSVPHISSRHRRFQSCSNACGLLSNPLCWPLRFII